MSKARELADLGSVTTRLDEVGNTDGALSNRNLIINGAMQVAQRGTSSSALGLKYLVADRFWTYGGASGTIEQSTDAPDGFNYSLHWNRTNGGSMGTSVELTRQGYNPYGMLTYSMYVKGDFTSTALYFNFRNYSGGGADSVPIVTHNSFGNYPTWTRVVLTVDCTGVVAHSNNKMLNIEFGGFPAGGKITGVQLEQGDTATPFEHRSYGDELARCQRYFERLTPTGIADAFADGHFWSSSSAYGTLYWKPKRANPTITHGTASNYRARSSGVSYTASSVAVDDANSIGYGRLYMEVSGAPIGSGCWFSRASTTPLSNIDVDAEL